MRRLRENFQVASPQVNSEIWGNGPTDVRSADFKLIRYEIELLNRLMPLLSRGNVPRQVLGLQS